MPSIQVVEYASPEELLQNDESAFSKMVQSTGAANAQYLRSLAVGEGDNKLETEETRRLDGQRRWLASSRWAAAAQFALAVSLTSHNDLIQLELEGDDSILRKTKDAVITLQGVLEGKHDKVIEETLDQYQVPSDRWWSSLYKMVEGMTLCHWMYNVLAFEPTMLTYLPGCSFSGSVFWDLFPGEHKKFDGFWKFFGGKFLEKNPLRGEKKTSKMFSYFKTSSA